MIRETENRLRPKNWTIPVAGSLHRQHQGTVRIGYWVLVDAARELCYARHKINVMIR